MTTHAHELALRLRDGPRRNVPPAGRKGRSVFVDFELLYLFSYDVELDIESVKSNSDERGPQLHLFARPEMSTVYHVWRERTVPGYGTRSITGELLWGDDAMTLREDNVTRSQVDVTIRTDDGAIIHLEYRIVGYLGHGGARRFTDAAGKDRIGTERNPFEFPIVSAPRFSTADHRYAWLNGHQGVGFGRGWAVNSDFRRATWDIYVLT